MPLQACVNVSTRTPSSGPDEVARERDADAPPLERGSGGSIPAAPNRGADLRNAQLGGDIGCGSPEARTDSPSISVCTTNPRAASCSFSANSGIDCKTPEMQRSSASW